MRRVFGALALLLSSSCGLLLDVDVGQRDDGPPGLDAGARDGGVEDAGRRRDAGERADSGPRSDAGARDGGVDDAGRIDGASEDAGERDASSGEVDAAAPCSREADWTCTIEGDGDCIAECGGYTVEIFDALNDFVCYLPTGIEITCTDPGPRNCAGCLALGASGCCFP